DAAEEGGNASRRRQPSRIGTARIERVLAEVARDRRAGGRLVGGTLLVLGDRQAPGASGRAEGAMTTAREVERGKVPALAEGNRARGHLRRQPRLREQAGVVAGVERPPRAAAARVEALEDCASSGRGDGEAVPARVSADRAAGAQSDADRRAA